MNFKIITSIPETSLFHSLENSKIFCKLRGFLIKLYLKYSKTHSTIFTEKVRNKRNGKVFTIFIPDSNLGLYYSSLQLELKGFKDNFIEHRMVLDNYSMFEYI